MPSKGVRSSLRQTLIRQDKSIRAELRAEMQQTGRDMQNWLTVVVRTWSNKPRFAYRVEIKPDLLRVWVDVAGSAKEIFHYVDQGTGKWGPKKSEYPIPKQVTPGKLLKFRTGYSPRTAPKAKITGGSGSANGPWVSTEQVMHPGIEPRNFTDKVTEELNPSFERRIENAIRRGIRKAN